MKEFFKQIKQLEKLEESERDKMIELLFDAELDLAYQALEELAEKIQKDERITKEKARIKAEQFINSIIFNEINEENE